MQHRPRQRGQGAIEGILVLVVLIATVLAILDFGQVIFVHQTLSERARAAARYAGIHPLDAEGARNLVLYGTTVAPAPPAPGFWGMDASMVTVARVNQNTNEDAVVVTISGFRFQVFSLWISGSARGKPIVASAPVEI
ncbi:MAG: pilus assembly protein [Acidobacteria bacterium]|nr:pilus assembly protein [Acidobacteriota bacterium]